MKCPYSEAIRTNLCLQSVKASTKKSALIPKKIQYIGSLQYVTSPALCETDTLQTPHRSLVFCHLGRKLHSHAANFNIFPGINKQEHRETKFSGKSAMAPRFSGFLWPSLGTTHAGGRRLRTPGLGIFFGDGHLRKIGSSKMPSQFLDNSFEALSRSSQFLMARVLSERGLRFRSKH